MKSLKTTNSKPQQVKIYKNIAKYNKHKPTINSYNSEYALVTLTNIFSSIQNVRFGSIPLDEKNQKFSVQPYRPCQTPAPA